MGEARKLYASVDQDPCLNVAPSSSSCIRSLSALMKCVETVEDAVKVSGLLDFPSCSSAFSVVWGVEEIS